MKVIAKTAIESVYC